MFSTLLLTIFCNPTRHLETLAFEALALSGDGKVVVGAREDSNALGAARPMKPVRWTADHGATDLDIAGYDGGQATCVSYDGNVIAGRVCKNSLWFNARWGPKLQIIAPDESALQFSALPMVSGDGNTIVGTSQNRVFVWTPARGLARLPVLDPSCPRSVAAGVSFDGSVIVGASSRGRNPGAAGMAEKFPSVLDLGEHDLLQGCCWLNGEVMGLTRKQNKLLIIPEAVSENGKLFLETTSLIPQRLDDFLDNGPFDVSHLAPPRSCVGRCLSASGELSFGGMEIGQSRALQSVAIIGGDVVSQKEFLGRLGVEESNWKFLSVIGASRDATVLLGHGGNSSGLRVSWLLR